MLTRLEQFLGSGHGACPLTFAASGHFRRWCGRDVNGVAIDTRRAVIFEQARGSRIGAERGKTPGLKPRRSLGDAFSVDLVH